MPAVNPLITHVMNFVRLTLMPSIMALWLFPPTADVAPEAGPLHQGCEDDKKNATMIVPGFIWHGMKTPSLFLVPSHVITMLKSRRFTNAGIVVERILHGES